MDALLSDRRSVSENDFRATFPANIAVEETIAASVTEFKDTGHTEWPGGRVLITDDVLAPDGQGENSEVKRRFGLPRWLLWLSTVLLAL